jgi:hypothetical protein
VTLHDVAAPDMVRQLPNGFALVIRSGNAPVIARLPRAWKNPAYRRARRRGLAPAFPGPFPLSADPGTDPSPGPEVDMFPDFLPPGWASGDDRSFPWS